MKIDVGNNEAFIKLSLDDSNNLDVTYAFNIDPITEEEANSDTLSPEAMARLMCISMFAGVVTSMRHYADTIISIGEDAIACGDFEIDSEENIALFDFIEGLSEEDQKLMNAVPKGEA